MDWKDRLTRFAGPQAKSGGQRQWYRIQNAAAADEADIYLYDVIDSWWGVSAQEFATEIRGITAKTLNIHINSPGGSAFDGLAIFQALRNHPARIVTYVDGLAASAASFIAMAGDKRVAAPYSTLMIHDAWALAVGDALVMEQARDELDRLSGTLAALYAKRSGVGDVDEWRTAMRAETWYTAQEAVDAGLMQEVQEDSEKGDEAGPSNRFDLSIFNFAGRDKAPAPRIHRGSIDPQPDSEEIEVIEPELPLAPAPQPDPAPKTTGAEPEESITEPKESPVATLSSDVLSRLGLTDDADDDAVKAAIDGLIVKASTPVQPDPQPTVPDEPDTDDDDEEVERRQNAAFAEMKAEITRLSGEVAAANAEKAATKKQALFDAACTAGKISPADRASWEARYDKAPDVIADILDSIAPEAAVPMQPTGIAGGGETDIDAEWERTMARLDGPVSSKGN